MTKMNSTNSSSDSALPPVYVVDDNWEICRSMEALLMTHGFEVTCFVNPVEFVETRARLDPGVVLLDLRMPEMNGLDVLAAIKADLGRFPTIMITGHGEIDAAVKAIKLGAKDFIQKPFREKALVEVIQSASGNVEADHHQGHQILDSLSNRERDVVVGLARGISNKLLAHELGISVRTVEMHRARAMQRLECKTFADLLRRVFSELPADHS